MSTKDTGGPAFPITHDHYDFDGKLINEMTGVTLRDWFAGQAMTGLLSGHDDYLPCSNTAQQAYAYADAMIKERSE